MAVVTKIVKMRLPKNGEVSTDAGSYAKAVTDAVGASTLDAISTCKAGSWIIATIVMH